MIYAVQIQVTFVFPGFGCPGVDGLVAALSAEGGILASVAKIIDHNRPRSDRRAYSLSLEQANALVPWLAAHPEVAQPRWDHLK